MILDHCETCCTLTEGVRSGLGEACKKCGTPRTEKPRAVETTFSESERPRMTGADRGRDRPS